MKSLLKLLYMSAYQMTHPLIFGGGLIITLKFSYFTWGQMCWNNNNRKAVHPYRSIYLIGIVQLIKISSTSIWGKLVNTRAACRKGICLILAWLLLLSNCVFKKSLRINFIYCLLSWHGYVTFTCHELNRRNSNKWDLMPSVFKLGVWIPSS